VLDGIEFGAERAIDHAAAELDHEPANDRGIDFDIEIDVLAADRLERAAQRGDVIVFERLGDRDFGRGLAFVLGDELAANSRRFAVTAMRNCAAKPPMPVRSSTAVSACNCSAAEKTGLRTSRARSGLSATSASKRSRSAFTASIALASRASSNSAVA
jgi:hypothetical protein